MHNKNHPILFPMYCLMILVKVLTRLFFLYFAKFWTSRFLTNSFGRHNESTKLQALLINHLNTASILHQNKHFRTN
jgi:hypothetical protein